MPDGRWLPGLLMALLLLTGGRRDRSAQQASPRRGADRGGYRASPRPRRSSAHIMTPVMVADGVAARDPGPARPRACPWCRGGGTPGRIPRRGSRLAASCAAPVAWVPYAPVPGVPEE